MRNRDQWVLWDLINGEKMPLHPLTLSVHDAHDPGAWVSYDAASKIASVTGKRIAFVFTKDDPYFFLDLDAALGPDGQWLPWAIDICSQFQGCAMEVSQSGTGLHIFGSYSGQEPEHTIKPTIPGANVDLFTSKRFVAITETSWAGDPDTDATTTLYRLISERFTRGTAKISTDWTHGPCDEWVGPEDDDDLLNRMLRAKSAGAIFGGKASLAALWNADPVELGSCFPDPNRPFDWSKADSALCAHLAWWTGKDCDRIDRLFRRSMLYRDKWERDDYRHNTVTYAASLCTSVYRMATQADPEVTEGIRPGFQFMTIPQQSEHFKGCVYVRDSHRIFVPDGALLKPEQFRVVYGGYVFAIDSLNDKTTRNAWEAFTESQALHWPWVHGTCFRPELEPGVVIEEGGVRFVNIYVPAIVESEPGDVGPFLQHIKTLLPDAGDQAIILSYLSACVQYPGIKFQWAPLIQGVEGNGKTFLVTCLSYALGPKYVHLPNAGDLGNKFNSWLYGKLLIGIEDIYIKDRGEVQEAIKPWITNPRVEIQGKGSDQTTQDNRANFLLFSNHRDAVIKTRKDRRFSVFYSAQQSPEDLVNHGMSGSYFPELYRWLRGGGHKYVTHWLKSYAIPDELNPAKDCHRAPDTSSTQEVLATCLGGAEQDILEAIGDGKQGFCGGWVSSMAVGELLQKRRISHNKRKDVLMNLGYVPHPALVEGRLNMPVPIEGGKPRLYVKAGSLLCSITSPAMIRERYMIDQGYVIQEGANAGISVRN